MYFASRMQAGRMLASQLAGKYRYENCAVVALSDGGVMVGAQIASYLHCVLTLLLTSEINLPREPHPVGGISEDGTFAYNDAYSAGEIEELAGEYYHYIEQEKMSQLSELHHLIGATGTIRRDLLRGRNIIVAADGMKGGFALDMVAKFLRPVAYEKLIIATPFADVAAVDRMHVVADEIYCLNVVEDYISTEHYYDKQDVPDHETVINTIERIILNWK